MTEEVIKTMCSHCNKPIVQPLSNPTSHIEALPEDVIHWTNGNAIVATGTPFEAVDYQGVSLSIALAVGWQAIEEGVTLPVTKEELKNKIDENYWSPEYRDYRRKSL